MNQVEEHVRKVLQKAEERVQKSVLPLYDLEDRKNPLVGSAVLLSTTVGSFLLTANHVLIHHSATRPLFLPVGSDLLPIEGSSSKSSEHDFAYIRLNPDLAARLISAKEHFLSPADIDVDDVPWPHSLYGFVGYPETKNRPVEPFVLRRSTSVFVVTPASPRKYAKLGLNQSTHFLGEFHIRELVVRTIKGTVTGPNPHGLSGGGVWRMARLRDFAEGATSEKLVGISIEYCRPERLLVGIRISLAIAALRDEYPVLTNELNESQRIRVNISRQ